MSKVKFGGFGGKIEQFGGDTAGGKQLVVRSGTVVDAIKIGSSSIGGGGGTETVNTTLPLDGIIILYMVSTAVFQNCTVVSSLDFSVNGRRFSAGNTKETKVFEAPEGVRAKILHAFGGTYIDSITFQVLPPEPAATLSAPVQVPSGTVPIDSIRSPLLQLSDVVEHATSWQLGSACPCRYLDRQTIKVTDPQSVLVEFRQHCNGDNINYTFQQGKIKIGGGTQDYAVRAGESEGYTNWNDGANNPLIFLDRQKVIVPQSTFLTGWHLESQDSNMRIHYWYANFQYEGKALVYSPDDVRRGNTPDNDGANKSIAYLDRHNVAAPEGCALLGFHVQRSPSLSEYFYIEYWYIPLNKVTF